MWLEVARMWEDGSRLQCRMGVGSGVGSSYN